MGIDQLKHVRRESTANQRPSNAAAAHSRPSTASLGATTTAAAMDQRGDGDSSSATNIHRLEEINEHRSVEREGNDENSGVAMLFRTAMD